MTDGGISEGGVLLGQREVFYQDRGRYFIRTEGGISLGQREVRIASGQREVFD